MFCTKCGKQLKDVDKFCSSCGTAKLARQTEPQSEQPYAAPQSNEIQQPYYGTPQPYNTEQPYNTQQPYSTEQPYNPYQPPYPSHSDDSSKKTMKILLAVGIPVVAVAATLIVLFSTGLLGGRLGIGLTGSATDILRINPDAVPVADALDIMMAEAGLRLETSPFQAIPIAIENFQDGAFTVTFDYRDEGAWGFANAAGSATLRSDTENSDFALEVDVNAMGFVNVDLSFFFNRERFAFGSSFLGEDFYGITYSTFADDIRIFGNVIGLSPDEIDDFASSVERFYEIDFEELSVLQYVQATLIWENFIRELDFISNDTEISVAGEQVAANRINVDITMYELLTFLDDMLEAVEDNALDWSSLFTHFDNGNDFEDEFANEIAELREELDYIKEEVFGNISFAFYIGRDGRLLRTSMDIYADDMGDITSVSAYMDFGASAKDNWTLSFETVDRWTDNVLTADWGIAETARGYENTLTMRMVDNRWNWDDTVSISSLWVPESGRFTLSFTDEWDTGSVGGVLDIQPNGFILQLDDFEVSRNEYLTLEIISEQGANIPQIEYIGLDEWGESLVDMIEGLLFALGLDWLLPLTPNSGIW